MSIVKRKPSTPHWSLCRGRITNSIKTITTKADFIKILIFVSLRGKNIKLAKTRKAVTFKKLDQRQTHVQKHPEQPRAVKTAHFNMKNMTFATTENTSI